MIIQHNLSAMNANRQMKTTAKKRAKNAEKLSSGYKINRSADDAAGLAISEKMRYQIRGLKRAAENIRDGISYVQVAEGALNEVHSMLQRMNELVVQSANDTNTTIDREALDAELQEIKEEIDSVFENTLFNDRKIWGENVGIKTKIGEVRKQAVAMNNTSESITITNANKGVFAYDDYYTFNADDTGLSISWIGYDGNHYETEVIDWDTLKANNYTFDMSDYFGSTTNNPLYDSNNMPVFKHKISFSVEESATIEDMKKCLDGIRMRNRITDYFSSGGSSGGFQHAAAYISGMDFEAYDDAFIEPADENGNILAAGVSNLYIPQNDSEHWKLYFNMQNIGLVTGTSSFSLYDSASQTYKDGDGTLGSFKSLVSDGIGNTAGAYIEIDFILTSAQDYTYGDGQTSNEIVRLSYRVFIKPTDTEQDVWNELNNKLNSNTVEDPYATSYGSHRSDIGTATENRHLINVPVYQITGGLMIQTGANAGDALAITYDKLDNTVLGIKDTNVLTHDDSSEAITTIANAINTVSGQRSTFGAYQNRLEHAYNNSKNTAENTQYAESRIRDTDMALEMVEYSKNKILQQTGQSMLAQANKNKDMVLKLLQG